VVRHDGCVGVEVRQLSSEAAPQTFFTILPVASG
jgi:hypothetical protein